MRDVRSLWTGSSCSETLTCWFFQTRLNVIGDLRCAFETLRSGSHGFWGTGCAVCISLLFCIGQPDRLCKEELERGRTRLIVSEATCLFSASVLNSLEVLSRRSHLSPGSKLNALSSHSSPSSPSSSFSPPPPLCPDSTCWRSSCLGSEVSVLIKCKRLLRFCFYFVFTEPFKKPQTLFKATF